MDLRGGQNKNNVAGRFLHYFEQRIERRCGEHVHLVDNIYFVCADTCLLYTSTLAADMYTPKNAAGKLSAIAVSGPFGAVKEQSSGLYAQTMAEFGFLTIAFDPSFTGESGGAIAGSAP